MRMTTREMRKSFFTASRHMATYRMMIYDENTLTTMILILYGMILLYHHSGSPEPKLFLSYLLSSNASRYPVRTDCSREE